jgi:hypothetical protein
VADLREAVEGPMAHGGHWECISESVEGFVRDEIPGLIQDLSLFTQGPSPPGATPPEGVTPEKFVLLCEADGHLRHMIVVLVDTVTPKNLLYAAYAFAAAGTTHEIEVAGIDDWENGAEGQVSGLIGGEVPISFCDALYPLTRDRYEIGKTYRFRVGALAYDIHLREEEDVEITDPETASRPDREMRSSSAAAAGNDRAPSKASLEGVAALLPIEEWDLGDDHFQVPIKQTSVLTIKGRKMFRLLVTAGRLAEADIDLCLYAGDLCLYAGAHRLPAGYVPKAGDDIGGKLWLQGHLVE